ncbi:hypothetical protein AAZX31_02G187900 [Glycine max]
MTSCYTFIQQNLNQRVVKECLGRAMANPKWLELFSEAYLINLVASIFDHTPLLLCSDCGQSHAWLAKKDLPDVVKAGWEKEEGGNFLSKVNSCVSELSHWGRRLSLVQEEMYWRQRAKAYWLKDGNMNSKFFHTFASTRKKRNQIDALMNVEGQWIDDQEGICELARSYFEDLFHLDEGSYDPVVDLVHPYLSEEDNHPLLALFMKEEVKAVLFDMHPDKSPSSDGLNPTFF